MEITMEARKIPGLECPTAIKQQSGIKPEPSHNESPQKPKELYETT